MVHYTVVKNLFKKPHGDIYVWIPTEGREPVYMMRNEERFHLVSLDSAFEDLYFATINGLTKYVEERGGEIFSANSVVGVAQFIMSKEPLSTYIDDRKICGSDAVAVLAKITSDNPELGITTKKGPVELSPNHETAPCYKVKAAVADGDITYTSDVYSMLSH